MLPFYVLPADICRYSVVTFSGGESCVRERNARFVEKLRRERGMSGVRNTSLRQEIQTFGSDIFIA